VNFTDLFVSLGPGAWAAILVFIFLMLLGSLAFAWRWFSVHRETLWNVAARAFRSIADSRLATRTRQRYPRAWIVVTMRFSPKHYLGLHLTLGLLVSLGALILFAAIAEDTLGGEELAVFDDIVATNLRTLATPRGTAALVFISALGGGLLLGALGLAVAVVLAFARNRAYVTGWSAAVTGALFLDQALKPLFHRARPETAWEFLHFDTWSFPSGHAMASLIVYGMLAYIAILFVRHTILQSAIISAACLLILAIGFSRLYIGVHYFTDVIGGYAAGAVWLSVCISAVEVVRRRALARAQAET
jgi:undecaprenyl-diphosphatase